MYATHRERFLAVLEEASAAAVVFSGTHKIRNADSEYRFRPESDFWYLTGFEEPDSVLVLAPGNDEAQSILFVRERIPEEETWTGRRLGVDRAPEALGVDQAYPISELWERMGKLLHGHERLVYASGRDETRDRKMIEIMAELRMLSRRGHVAPDEWLEPTHSLHELRLRKSEEELEDMRRAAAITTEAHRAVMAQAGPGVNEAELDALLDYTFRRRGSTGGAYTNIVAGGINATVLHYVENDDELENGELLLIDAGAEWNYYASDVTRTFPVNGKFSPRQRQLYDVVLRAQHAAIEAIRPGTVFQDVHEASLKAICEGLIDLSLVQGSLDEVIEKGLYQPFFMHKTSHWLGLDVHDCGPYFVEGDSRALEPGMVLTVEPGIYVPIEGEVADGLEPEWRGIGIRIEDDILVTRDGHENLTPDIPKDPEEVEAACRVG